jgi:hypothetical protein
VKDEQIEIGHRCHGLHNLGLAHEPTPERRPWHVVCHQQSPHGAAPAAPSEPVLSPEAIKQSPVGQHPQSTRNAVRRRPRVLIGDRQRTHDTPGLGEGGAGQAIVPTPPEPAMLAEFNGRNATHDLRCYRAIAAGQDRGKDAQR